MTNSINKYFHNGPVAAVPKPKVGGTASNGDINELTMVAASGYR